MALAAPLVATAGARPAAAATASDESVAYQIDAGHSGGQPGDSLTPPLGRKWSVDLGGPLSYPLIAGGEIFVSVMPQLQYGSSPNSTTQLYAFEASTGVRRWGPVSLAVDAPLTTIAYDRAAGVARIFAVNSTTGQTGVVSAFDALTGAPLWRTVEAYGQGIGHPPLAVNGTLFVNVGFYQQAIDEASGAIKWTVDSEGPMAATPSGVYTGGYCGNVRDVSPIAGATIWSTPSSCWNNLEGYPVISAGRLYQLSASWGQYLPTIYDAARGIILGHFKADMPPVFDGSIGVFVAGSVVRAQDLATGAALWSFTGDCDIYTLPVAANGYVYIASAQGNLYALRERSGALAWSDNVGARIVGEGASPFYPSPSLAMPALAIGEGLLAVPAGSKLIVYGSAPQDTPWTPAPTSGPGAAGFQQHAIPNPSGSLPPPTPSVIATGADGNLWFIEPRRNRIAKMTPAGAVTEYDIPTAQSWPVSLTPGPDGAIWFTEQNTYKVGRIDANGAIREFPTPVDRGDIRPSAPAGPYGITTGPDGALWFTNVYGDEIDRMTVSGAITVFHLPLRSGPMNITFGPDGNVWFTQADSIGRMAPDGSGYVQFDLPTYLNQRELPGQIITGPDGNLWFVEGGAYDPLSSSAGSMGGIGRIAPNGTITDFQTPTPASGPTGIVAGPDGNLWFTENNIYFHEPNKVGRITPQGQMTEYWIPTAAYGSHPYGITRTSDGALWLTEAASDSIARFDIASPTCPAPPATGSTTPASLLPGERVPGSAPAPVAGRVRPTPPPAVPQAGATAPAAGQLQRAAGPPPPATTPWHSSLAPASGLDRSGVEPTVRLLWSRLLRSVLRLLRGG